MFGQRHRCPVLIISYLERNTPGHSDRGRFRSDYSVVAMPVAVVVRVRLGGGEKGRRERPDDPGPCSLSKIATSSQRTRTGGEPHMGGGSQRSAGHGRRCLLRGAFFCGLRPDDEKNYQQFGQRRLLHAVAPVITAARKHWWSQYVNNA
jgi:hypothetical protein